MHQQQPATIASATRSEVENVPEIQALTLRVEALTQSVDFWNQLMVWGLAAAAIAAVFIVVSTRIVVSRTGQLSTAQDLLREAKDRQLQVDLSQKGIEIGNLTVAAGAAETEIATAKTEMAKQETRAATAEKALLELQQRLAHRRIDKAEQDKIAALLLPFPSVVRFTKLNESEAGPFADDLLAIFQAAHWSVQLSINGSVSPPRYGLVCVVDESSSAGKALAKALKGLPTANVTPSTLNGAVADITVGLRPPA